LLGSTGSVRIVKLNLDEGDEAAAANAQTLAVGEIVAEKYRIERLIGCGGMAEVYAAVNVKTERRVALKWILPMLAKNREVMLRFRREALAAGRIVHPNVVAIFDVVEHQGSACMVMELLEGEMLSERLVRLGPLPFVEAVAIILPAMRGVAAAHAQRVIHRDLKPHNIFLCLDAAGSICEVKVLDFGVSKLAVVDAATAGDITLSGNVVGTPEYMAPEQVRSGKGIDHRIDIYSLGVVLYEMLAGRPPFVNAHFSGLMLDIMQNDAPPLAGFRADVPRRLAGVIQRAMAREADRRFADVPAFIGALEAVARDDLKMLVGTPPEGVLTRAGFPRPTPPSATEPLEVPRRPRRAALWIGGAALLTVIVGGMAVARWRSAPAGREPGPEATAQPQPSPQPPATAPAPAEAARAEAPAAEAPPASKLAAATDRAPAGGASPATARPEGSAPGTARHAAAVAPPVSRPVGAHLAPVAGGKPVVSVRPPRAGKLTVDDF
jgi:tRNA A-37 threonylcarbamoyl transferase component Bud32